MSARVVTVLMGKILSSARRGCSPRDIFFKRLSVLQTRISDQHNTEISIEQFRETVKECLNVTELTPFILNKLISKIEIGCLEMFDGENSKWLAWSGSFYKLVIIPKAPIFIVLL